MSLECRDEIQQDDVSSQAQPAAQPGGRAAAVAAPLGSLHAQPTILNSTNQVFSAPYPTVPQTWTRTHTHKHPTHHNPPPVCDIHELPPQLPPAGGLCRRRDQPVCRSVQPLLAHPASHLPCPTAATSPCTLPPCPVLPLTVPPSCPTTPLWAEAKALCASEKQCQGGVLDCLRSKQDEIKGEECRNEVFSALQMQVRPRRWRTLQGCRQQGLRGQREASKLQRSPAVLLPAFRSFAFAERLACRLVPACIVNTVASTQADSCCGPLTHILTNTLTPSKPHVLPGGRHQKRPPNRSRLCQGCTQAVPACEAVQGSDACVPAAQHGQAQVGRRLGLGPVRGLGTASTAAAAGVCVAWQVYRCHGCVSWASANDSPCACAAPSAGSGRCS